MVATPSRARAPRRDVVSKLLRDDAASVGDSFCFFAQRLIVIGARDVQQTGRFHHSGCEVGDVVGATIGVTVANATPQRRCLTDGFFVGKGGALSDLSGLVRLDCMFCKWCPLHPHLRPRAPSPSPRTGPPNKGRPCAVVNCSFERAGMPKQPHASRSSQGPSSEGRGKVYNGNSRYRIIVS